MEYEENRNNFKLCALCDARINKQFVVCKDHMADMELYRNEQWFQELVRMQERQYQIDVEEYTLLTRSNLPTLPEKRSKSRGKQLTNEEKFSILKLYNSGLGDRRIAKALNLEYHTVRTYLWRYRKMLRISGY